MGFFMTICLMGYLGWITTTVAVALSIILRVVDSEAAVMVNSTLLGAE